MLETLINRAFQSLDYKNSENQNHFENSYFIDILGGENIRNPDRLDSFYDELKKIHKEHFPDWRFGQWCSNFFGWLASEKKMDLFFPEEDKMIEYIREFAGIK